MAGLQGIQYPISSESRLLHVSLLSMMLIIKMKEITFLTT